MCEFVSWIEKDDDIIFLTGDDVFRSKRGKALQKYCQSYDDLPGHGAIRWYYNFTGGHNRECTDFTTPDNFPPEIVKAIKSGEMRGLGVSHQLLTHLAWAEFDKITHLARGKFDKIKRAALAEFDKIRRAAWGYFDKIKRAALPEYNKIERAAWAEFDKIRQPVFWDMFKNKKNRAVNWR